MKTISLFEKELKKEYPSGIVSDLKRTNEDLYNRLKTFAKKNNTSIKELLEQNDYIYLRKSIIRLYVDDFIELEKLYPDYIVKSFYEKDNKLYYKVLSHAKSLKVSMKKYLNSLGFEYIARDELSDNLIKNELLEMYPNKKIENLSTKNNKLYYRVYQYARKNNQTIKEYLESLGFSINDNNENNNKKKNVKQNKNEINKKETNEEILEQPKKKRGRPRKNTLENEKKTNKSIKKTTKNKKSNTKTNKKKNPPINNIEIEKETNA